MTLDNPIQVNHQRLWDSLMEMARIGATEKGGCNRQALTDEDKAGRDLFVQWCRDAGCVVTVDEIGNIFARRSGGDPSANSVLIGSHLDTQPTGGKFDGVYGVLAGLEVVRTLNDAGATTDAPIEVAAWTNEEGSRFPSAMLGSAVWSGAVAMEDAAAEADNEGRTVAEELARIGYRGGSPARARPLKAAFELHIEQGPILEAEAKTIGIVTGVQHMSRHRIEIEGQEAHAGPTPMHLRRDPMMALARFLPRLYELATEQGPDGRITFGVVEVSPGSVNTIPGHLTMTADIRHPDATAYEAMTKQFKSIVEADCAVAGLDVRVSSFWEAPGVSFDADCISAVKRAAEAIGYPAREIVSGAGHDSCNIASVAPASMIFIPCKDGLSHNEAEDASPQHVAAGANVLLHAVLDRAGAGSHPRQGDDGIIP